MTDRDDQAAAEALDPDVLARDDDRFAGVAEPGLDVLLDIEEQEQAMIADPDDLGRPVGRLGAPGPDDDMPVDFDDEADAVAWAADADDMSAEEAAIHITTDPSYDDR